MSSERMFPRAVAVRAHELSERTNDSIARKYGEGAVDRTLENDLRELVESYDSSG